MIDPFELAQQELQKMDRIQALEGIKAYSHLRDELMVYLQSFAGKFLFFFIKKIINLFLNNSLNKEIDDKKIVTAQDITLFFQEKQEQRSRKKARYEL